MKETQGMTEVWYCNICQLTMSREQGQDHKKQLPLHQNAMQIRYDSHSLTKADRFKGNVNQGAKTVARFGKWLNKQ